MKQRESNLKVTHKNIMLPVFMQQTVLKLQAGNCG